MRHEKYETSQPCLSPHTIFDVFLYLVPAKAFHALNFPVLLLRGVFIF